MNYSDLKQYTINALPVLTWGCRVAPDVTIDALGGGHV